MSIKDDQISSLEQLREDSPNLSGSEWLKRLGECFEPKEHKDRGTQVGHDGLIDRIDALIAAEESIKILTQLNDLRFYVSLDMFNRSGLVYADALVEKWEDINEKFKGELS